MSKDRGETHKNKSNQLGFFTESVPPQPSIHYVPTATLTILGKAEIGITNAEIRGKLSSLILKLFPKTATNVDFPKILEKKTIG